MTFLIMTLPLGSLPYPRWADGAIAVSPNHFTAWNTLGEIALERGHWTRSRAAFEVARRVGTDVEAVNELAGTVQAEARAGSVREARRILQHAESLAAAYKPAPLHTAVYLAQAYVALGDPRHAIAWLRRYTPLEDLRFQLHLRCDPPFDPIEREPDFRSLLLVGKGRPARGC